MTIEVCGMSVIGAKKSNDDHFVIGREVSQEKFLRLKFDPDRGTATETGLLVAVADGIGSYEGGALASKVALEALAEDFYQRTSGTLKERVTHSLKTSLRVLNARLKQEGKRKAGTTLAGLALQAPDQALVFHIGDSRVLRFREGQLRSLTIDHTPVGEPLARGKIDLETALTRPDAFHLTRSYGMWVNTRVDVQARKYTPGDWFLLTTDGVCSPGRGLDANALTDFLTEPGEPQTLLTSMLEQANALDGDNATIVSVRVGVDK